MYPRSNDFGRLQSLCAVLAAADVLGSDNGRWWASIAEFFRALGAAELGVSVAQYTYAFSHEALTQNVAPFVVRADAAAQSANRLTTIVDVVMQLHVDAHVAAAFTHPEIRLDEMLQSLAVVPMVAVHARSEVEALFLTHWRVELRYSSGQRSAQYFRSRKQAERAQQGLRPGPDEFGRLASGMQIGNAGEVEERTLYAPGVESG